MPNSCVLRLVKNFLNCWDLLYLLKYECIAIYIPATCFNENMRNVGKDNYLDSHSHTIVTSVIPLKWIEISAKFFRCFYILILVGIFKMRFIGRVKDRRGKWYNTEVYSEPNQTSKVVLFAEVVDGFSRYFRKKLHRRCLTEFWMRLSNKHQIDS